MPTISFEARDAKRDLENKVVPARAAALPFKKDLREVFISVISLFHQGIFSEYQNQVLLFDVISMRNSILQFEDLRFWRRPNFKLSYSITRLFYISPAFTLSINHLDDAIGNRFHTRQELGFDDVVALHGRLANFDADIFSSHQLLNAGSNRRFAGHDHVQSAAINNDFHLAVRVVFCLSAGVSNCSLVGKGVAAGDIKHNSYRPGLGPGEK